MKSTDSLMSGVAFMMVLTVAQRAVGFVRTALFCRLLTEQELGQWSLVFSCIMLFAPLTVMGITGSFGRYVEHYYRKGQVRQFFLLTGISVAGLLASVTVVLLLGRSWFAWAIFGSSAQQNLIPLTCLTLVTTVTFNYFLETVIALRRIRVGSVMELTSSWTFALLGVTLVYVFQMGTFGAVAAYAAGNLVASLYALRVLTTSWGELPASNGSLRIGDLTRKVAPFAIGLWLINLVANLFDQADRYMIIHFSKGAGADAAQELVGQYFSSLTMPLMMLGVSTMLAHRTMPYLSEDWEAGRKGEVSKRLNLALKLVGGMQAFGATAILLMSPYIFESVFGGKYDEGLRVLPITVGFACWTGFAIVAQNYLFCVERTRLTLLANAAGLASNVAFNALLLPWLGLYGAALATASGWLVNLSLVLAFSVRLGLRFDWRCVWVMCFPLSLIMGSYVVVPLLGALVCTALMSTLVFTVEEKTLLRSQTGKLLARALPAKRDKATVHSS